jgi:hypothetical protein
MQVFSFGKESFDMDEEISRWDVRRDPLLQYVNALYQQTLRSLGLDPDNVPPGFPQWDDFVREHLPQMGKQLIEQWRGRTTEELARRKIERAMFEERLHTIWGDALNGLEQLIIMSREIGSTLHERHTWRIGEPQEHWVDAVFSLHARGVLVGREILSLLRAGFAAGAEARWRTLHEIAVVALFIAKHGPDTAKRYLDHDHIAHFRSMQHYQRNCGVFGTEPYSDDEVSEAERNKEELVRLYGENFAREYGWAASALKPGNPKFQPTFADLEAEVDLGPWRVAYAYASQSVHAGPRGFRDDLGNPDADRGAMLVGASLSGLIEPGTRSVSSILLLARACCARHPWMEDLTFISAMDELAKEIVVRFQRANKAELAARENPQG